MTAPIFQAGGLASGLDTNSIIDALVKAESAPINLLRARQSALKVQVSSLGDLASKLAGLEAAARDMATGVVSVKQAGSTSAFGVATSSSSVEGRYSVQVGALAQAAKARSAAFASSTALVTGGNLHLSVKGAAYDISITDGMQLVDVASAIRASGAPVSVSLLNDGTSTYLSLSNRDTGFVPGQAPSSALQLTETYTGSQGQALGLAVTQAAQNASVTVDGVTFVRQSNTVSDAVPGTTLSLTSQGGPAEDLVLQNDPTGTQTRLQNFVDAYNSVAKTIQKQLDVNKDTDRDTTLAGDSSVRALQGRLQGLLTAVVPGLGTVRSLSDLGIGTDRSGLLTIDTAPLSNGATLLANAIARDPAAVNAIFAQASSGLTDKVKQLSSDYTAFGSGILLGRQNSLNATIKRMDDDATRMQARVDAYKTHLVAQFTAMEKVISALKSAGNYLTQATTSTSGGGK